MTILFDSSACVKPVTFGHGVLPIPAVKRTTVKPAREPFLFTHCNAADMARIDSVRRDAYHTALRTMSQAEAEDFAGEASVRELELVWAEKAAAKAMPVKKSRERRAPFTASDLAWAAANLNAEATDYEVVGRSDAAIEFAAGCAMAQARLDAGFSGL